MSLKTYTIVKGKKLSSYYLLSTFGNSYPASDLVNFATASASSAFSFSGTKSAYLFGHSSDSIKDGRVYRASLEISKMGEYNIYK